MQLLEEYMQGLKQWLQDTKDSPLEEMSDFFAKRLQGYEEHMSVWEESYRMIAGQFWTWDAEPDWNWTESGSGIRTLR